nr:hypothetical protein [Candidatus Sigynarchaeota archaeon]
MAEKADKSLVVKNAVSDLIRGKGYKVSGELFEDDGFNKVLKEVIDKACARCEANGRKTVMKQDL